MSMAVEAQFITALALQALWTLFKVDLDTVKRRIDFEVPCNQAAASAVRPSC